MPLTCRHYPASPDCSVRTVTAQEVSLSNFFIEKLCLVAEKMKGKKTMIPLFLIDLLVLNMVSFFSFFDRTVSLRLCVFYLFIYFFLAFGFEIGGVF